MGSNFFRIGKGVTLAPQGSVTSPQNGDVYYDSSRNTYVFRNNSQNVDLQSRSDVASAASLTSSNFTLSIIQSSLVKLTGSTQGDIHGIAASSDAKTFVLYNATTQQQIIKNQSSTESTAANRIITSDSADLVLTAGQAAQLGYDSTQSRWVVLSSPGSGSGSGSGSIDFLDNGRGQLGSTTGWAMYADGAVTRPVDGTGGTATGLSIASSTTNPLRFDSSLIMTKDAANRQGSGWSYDFTVDNNSKAKMLSITKRSLVNSGTFVAGSGGPSGTDSDAIIYMYDVTNSRLIEPSSIKIFSNSSTLSDEMEYNFQTSPDSTSYRLIVHIATTSASAWSLKMDMSVSPSEHVYGTPIGDWIAFTPTASGMGTLTNAYGFYRRIGDSIECRGAFTVGTPTAATAGVNLPSGLSFDSTKLLNGGGYKTFNGFFIRGILNTTTNMPSNGVGPWAMTALPGSTSYIHTSSNSTALNMSTVLANAIVTSGDICEFEFNGPIAGWSSSLQISDHADTRVVAAAYSGTPTGTLNASLNTATLPTREADTHAAYSSGVYTVPVSGFYEVEACLVVTGATITVGTSFTSMAVTLSGASKFGSNKYADVNTEIETQASGLIFATAGQTIELKHSVNNITTPSYLSTFRNHLSIKRVSGPAAIAANETVVTTGSTAAGTALTGGAITQISFTSEVDTHGSWSTNVFTAQAAGLYYARVQFDASMTLSTTNSFNSYIYKNGSPVAQYNTVGSGGSANFFTSVSKIIRLNAGDTIDFRVRSSINTSLSTSSVDNFFDIKRIGL